MQDSHDNLTPKQVTALTALLAGRTVEAAALAAKVNPATVHRWLAQPDFQAAHRAARRELAQQGLALVQTLVCAAVGTVADILGDRTQPPSIRLRAAQIVLETTVRWIETDDLARRLEELEKRYATQL